MLVVRLAVGRTDVAWVVFALVAVGFGYVLIRAPRPAAINPGLLLAIAGGFWLVLVWLLWQLGALAMSIARAVNLLAEQIPWTLDMSRWYAWYGWFFGAVVAGLAYWGFRNVLGRQSAFPSGALDG